MAEIQIERKERSAWPWVLLGILLLALVVWWLLGRRQGGDDMAVTETQSGVADTAPAIGIETAEMAPGAVNDFVSYVNDNRARESMAPEHQFTADGIRRLAAALGEIIERDTIRGAALRPQMDVLLARADALQRDEQSTNHARYAHDAFTRAVSLMDDLAQSQYPNVVDAVSESRQAAEAVQPGRLLLEQRDQVQRFFDRAATALRSMAKAQGSPGARG